MGSDFNLGSQRSRTRRPAHLAGICSETIRVLQSPAEHVRSCCRAHACHLCKAWPGQRIRAQQRPPHLNPQAFWGGEQHCCGSLACQIQPAHARVRPSLTNETRRNAGKKRRNCAALAPHKFPRAQKIRGCEASAATASDSSGPPTYAQPDQNFKWMVPITIRQWLQAPEISGTAMRSPWMRHAERADVVSF